MTALTRCFNVHDLRNAARRRLPRGVFDFVDGGTEDGVALANNRAAFDRIKLRNRALRDVSGRSLATELFDKPMRMPLAIAPTGAVGLCWYNGELELAKAAAKAQVPFALAVTAMTSLEDVARVAGPHAGGRLWFQLYVWKERELSYQIVRRARAAGYEALIITIDTIVSANREYNARNGFILPFQPTLRFSADIARHPRWIAEVLLKYLRTGGMPRHENYPEAFRSVTTGAATREIMRQDTLNWEDVRVFRDMWPGPLMLKGINRADDAERAVAYGVDAIIVSNHGGRNMDSSPATIDVLPDIVAAVGSRIPIILDSGIRRGSDIVKALALGARAVLTGRATLYGTALAGMRGAEYALDLLRNEADKTMAYVGCRTVDEITADILFARGNG